MENLYLLAFGTFGHPNDFRQNIFISDDPNIAKSIRTFDLNINAIKIFPRSKLYSIRKENISGVNSIAYSIYSYAKEQNSEREGTFIGASFFFTDKIPEENLILNKLNEFHSNLISENVKDNILLVKHSKDFSIPKIDDFDKLGFNINKAINFIDYCTTNYSLVVLCRTDNNTLQQNFKKSLDLLSSYDTIYFTDNKEIVEFSIARGIYTTVDEKGFEKEIQNFKEEKKLKIQVATIEFEKEKEKLELEKKTVIEEIKLQIENNEKLHYENGKRIEDSKKELTEVNKKYSCYEAKVNESINELKSGRELNEVKEHYKKNKNLFIDSINLQKSQYLIDTISTSNSKTYLRTNIFKPINYEEEKYNYGHTKASSRGQKSNSFKGAFFLSLLLWVGTIIYFLIFIPYEEDNIARQYQETQTPAIEEPDLTVKIVKELSPLPNSQLTEKDYKSLAKKIKEGMEIQEVVNIIFDSNPKDIKNTYSNQSEIYSGHLLKLNKDCFKELNNILHMGKDTLRFIPTYIK
ncbi:MAG: hypothetical protein V4663_02745 [Bacteroidota bacterium]